MFCFAISLIINKTQKLFQCFFKEILYGQNQLDQHQQLHKIFHETRSRSSVIS